MPLYLGDVVGVDVIAYGVSVHHVGVVSRVGPLGVYVISNSKRRGGVVEERIEDFVEGGTLTHHPQVRGKLRGHDVVERARSRIGHPWDLTLSNCEHFVRWAHGLPVRSPQLVAKGLVGAVGAVGVVGLLLVTGLIGAEAPAGRSRSARR